MGCTFTPVGTALPFFGSNYIRFTVNLSPKTGARFGDKLLEIIVIFLVFDTHATSSDGK